MRLSQGRPLDRKQLAQLMANGDGLVEKSGGAK
jgi:hypothetical protein